MPDLHVVPSRTDSPAGPPAIATREIAKDYLLGTQVVHGLRGVTVTIGRGEMVAIMGASGSGKSTFLNIVGCLDTPTSGQYLLDGQDASALSDDELSAIRNAKIGFVFQQFNLLPKLTAVANVELPLVYGPVPRREHRPRALARLEAVGLGGVALHRPSELSGGEQQRVAIARALVNEPVLFLADEPTGNLDTRTSLEIMAILQSLNRQGITIVLVTHERDIALHARRILTFRDGRLVDDRAVADPRDARDGVRAGAVPA